MTGWAVHSFASSVNAPYLFLLFGQLDPLDQQSELDLYHLFIKMGFHREGWVMAPHLRFGKGGREKVERRDQAGRENISKRVARDRRTGLNRETGRYK